MQLAGIVGVHPAAFTLRELVVMSLAKQRSDWNRTSASMALFANANRDPKKTPVFLPNDFNPLVPRIAEPKAGIESLKVFLHSRRV